jgi:hypothetical protein
LETRLQLFLVVSGKNLNVFAIKFVGVPTILRFSCDKLPPQAVRDALLDAFELDQLAQLTIQSVAAHAFEQ